MSEVKFLKGNKANLPATAIIEGALYFTIDTGELFDSPTANQPLVKIGDVYSGYVDLVDLQTKNPAIKGKLYLTDEDKMYSYSNGGYKEISGGFSGTISADKVIENSQRVFVTNADKSQIGSNTTELNSHSQRIAELEQSASDVCPDEKVKMNALGSGGYLEDLIDSDTIINDNGKLSASTLLGLTATLQEINELQGATGNIQAQINALSSIGNFTTTVDSYVDLQLIQSPLVNDMVIVLADETKQDSPTTIYIYNGVDWVFTGDFKGGEIRNFTTDPIDLALETTGVLQKSKYEKQNASETSVTDTAGNLTATNVEDALAELFTYANNIKSIANVIGYPLSVSDTSTILNNKTQQLKADFANNLIQKGTIAYPYNTLAELINKVLSIPNITVDGLLKKVSKLNITAPYELRIQLTEALSLTDIATTLIEFVAGSVGLVHYNLDFNNGDESNFESNQYIYFDGKMKLIDNLNLATEKVSSWQSDGTVYKGEFNMDDFSEVFKLHLLY